MNAADDFDPMLDCYRSWEAFIAWLRARWLAGEPIPAGPWAKPPIEIAGKSEERTSDEITRERTADHIGDGERSGFPSHGEERTSAQNAGAGE